MSQKYQHVYKCNRCSGQGCPCFFTIVNYVATDDDVSNSPRENHMTCGIFGCKFKYEYSIPFEDKV